MNFLLIGSGGREHALAYKLSKSPIVHKLYAIPGSDAISQYAECVDLSQEDFSKLADFCKNKEIELVVVGPETPLVKGISDALSTENILVFGPDQYGAQLEGSKSFTKQLCQEYNIPTAAYEVFENSTDALSYIEKVSFPIVLKADGLAAGKGVVIAENIEHARDTLDHMFSGGFGTAGERVVIEEFLTGEEASLFVITDGENMVVLPPAQDHKRVFDGDEGPNTGGMGAYAPAPLMTKERVQHVLSAIIEPTLKGMKARGHPFKGVLYAGLMVNEAGAKLIEYNVRFGDPECQALMALLDADLGSILLACAKGELITQDFSETSESAACIVLVNSGYPGAYAKGDEISGLSKQGSDIDQKSELLVFHAGTCFENGAWRAMGGRVLNLVSRQDSLKEALDAVYKSCEAIGWKNAFYRKDIGQKGLKKS